MQGLGNVGSVLPPTTDLLNQILMADNGQVNATQAAQLDQSAKDAVALAEANAPGGPSVRSGGSVLLNADGKAVDSAVDALVKAATTSTSSGATIEKDAKNLLHSTETLEGQGNIDELTQR